VLVAFALCPKAGTLPQMRQQKTGTQLTKLLLGVYLKTIQEVPFCQHMNKFGIRIALLMSVKQMSGGRYAINSQFRY
jgi:hypothetical protein